MTLDRYLNQEALDPPPGTSWAKLLSLVPRGARVLDVGCGHGAFSAALRRLRACHVTGLEPVTAFGADARARCDVFIQGDIETAIREKRLGSGFDVIVTSDVLEHLAQPEEVLEGLRELLAKGGAVIASIPNATHLSVVAELAAGRFPRRAEGLLDATHVQFYGASDAIALFQQAGFAASIVDRVVIDPRLTEFRTDLSAVPADLVAFVDSRGDGKTYQFIIRGIPKAWAPPSDRELPALPPPATSVHAGLAKDLADTSTALTQYEALASRKDGELRELNERLRHYHEALTREKASASTLRQVLQERDAVIAQLDGDALTEEERRLYGEWRAPQRRHASGLRVLYVADRDDAPYRYRCVHGCEQLRAAGALANIARLGDDDLLDAIPSYGVIVLFRLPWSERVGLIIEAARASGATIAFEIDDLVFDPSVEPLMPFLSGLGMSAVEDYRRTFAGLRRTFEAADLCITTTAAIARYARRLGKPTLVHPNLLSEAQTRACGLISLTRSTSGRRPLIGYFSGSNTHDGDLGSIAEPIAESLGRHPDLTLLLAGHVDIPTPLVKSVSQIVRVGYLDHRVYPWIMARCRAVLAPIEAINDFTHGKSALKVFEAGVLGVPTIASPTAPYRAAVDAGVSGFIADSPEAWGQAIDLVADAGESNRLGYNARAKALAGHTAGAWRGVLADRLLPHQGRFAGRAPALRPLNRGNRSLAAKTLAHAQLARQIMRIGFRMETASALLHEEDARRLAEYAAAAPRSGRSLLGVEAHGLALIDETSRCVELEPGLGTWVFSRGVEAGNAVACLHADPMLVTPTVHVPSGATELVIRARVRSDVARPRFQLFWSATLPPTFSEEDSAVVSLCPDDTWHIYGVTLGDRVQGKTLRFRVDPIDTPGAVELSLVALVPLSFRPARQAPDLDRASTDASAARPVDVVIPVYNARRFTRACVKSVLRHASGDCRVVLIDDCSTDPGVREDLEAFARADRRVVLLCNEQNMGFVSTANRGLRQATGRDVLLLNSDTEVFAGFLDRMRAALAADPSTGILTPFSNNATICSVPDFPNDNPIPAGHTPESMDLLVAACSQRQRPELPTGVGFCMWIKAEVLAKVGYFDEESFGRGYGEENDLCLRARAAGFKVRLCDDVFVFHKGKASFGDEGRNLESLAGRNAARLEAKHPGYHAEIARFIESNPLAPLHHAIRFHLPRARPGSERAVLFILHLSPWREKPGGTEFHVIDLVRALRLPRVVVTWPETTHLRAAEIFDGEVDAPLFHDFPTSVSGEEPSLLATTCALRRLVELLGVSGVHIHHLMFWPLGIARALKQAAVEYVWTHHDYLAVCPNWNLYDFAQSRPCGCRLDDRNCLEDFSRVTGALRGVDVDAYAREHRAAMGSALAHARAHVFPSDAARVLFESHLGTTGPDRIVIEHGYDIRPTAERPSHNSRLRIAFVGEVAYPIKGANRYLELLEQLVSEAGLEWHVFGDVEPFGYKARLQSLGMGDRLVIHGRYPRHVLPDLLRTHGIDLCVLLPDWHETFSYVLSESFIAGVPAIVMRRGALATRMARAGAGATVDSAEEAGSLIRALLRDRTALADWTARAHAYEHRPVTASANEHRALYERLGWLTRRPLAVADRPRLLEFLGTDAEPPVAAVQPDRHLLDRAERKLRRLAGATPLAGPLRRVAFAARGIRPLKGGCLPSPRASWHDLAQGPWSPIGVSLQALSNDPRMSLAFGEISTDQVTGFVFEARHTLPDGSFAQLYWAFEQGQGFSEDHSARTHLGPGDGEWRSYRIALDAPLTVARWHAGPRIAELRFDPCNAPGRIALRGVALEFKG